jgi:hypothetical protein
MSFPPKESLLPEQPRFRDQGFKLSNESSQVRIGRGRSFEEIRFEELEQLFSYSNLTYNTLLHSVNAD